MLHTNFLLFLQYIFWGIRSCFNATIYRSIQTKYCNTTRVTNMLHMKNNDFGNPLPLQCILYRLILFFYELLFVRYHKNKEENYPILWKMLFCKKKIFYFLDSIYRLKFQEIMQLHMHIMNLIWCVLSNNHLYLPNGYNICETKQSILMCLLLLEIWRVSNNSMYRENELYN